MIISKLVEQKKIHPPKWLPDNMLFAAIVGSESYGVSSGGSDIDVYGIVMPPLEMIFPHLSGEIPDFGIQKQRFNVWQEHHVKTDNDKEYDFQIYSIVKFFHLAMENNPNILGFLFVPNRCILHNTHIGQTIRSHRKDFLHKGAYHKYKGYSFSQMHKMRNHANSSNPKRKESIEKYSFDAKFAYHLVRLLDECEQILLTGDLDIEQNREKLKAIRRGEWSIDDIENYFKTKEASLEELYSKSTIPIKPNEDKIKALLMGCIEEHYGSISKTVNIQTSNIVNDLEQIIQKYKG
jgi:predicted nucleotidyltransferase